MPTSEHTSEQNGPTAVEPEAPKQPRPPSSDSKQRQHETPASSGDDVLASNNQCSLDVVPAVNSDRQAAGSHGGSSSAIDEPDSTQNATCADCRELRREVHEVKEQLQFLIDQFNMFSNHWRPNSVPISVATAGGVRGAPASMAVAWPPTVPRRQNEPSGQQDTARPGHKRSSSPPLSTLSTSSSQSNDSVASQEDTNGASGANLAGTDTSAASTDKKSFNQDTAELKAPLSSGVVKPTASVPNDVNHVPSSSSPVVKNEHLAVTPPQLTENPLAPLGLGQSSQGGSILDNMLLKHQAELKRQQQKQQQLQSISPPPHKQQRLSSALSLDPPAPSIATSTSLLRPDSMHLSRMLLSTQAQAARPPPLSLPRSGGAASAQPHSALLPLTTSVSTASLHHHPLLSPTAVPGAGLHAVSAHTTAFNALTSSSSAATLATSSVQQTNGGTPTSTTAGAGGSGGNFLSSLLLWQQALQQQQAGSASAAGAQPQSTVTAPAMTHATLPLINDNTLEQLILAQRQQQQRQQAALAAGAGHLAGPLLTPTTPTQALPPSLLSNSELAASLGIMPENSAQLQSALLAASRLKAQQQAAAAAAAQHQHLPPHKAAALFAAHQQEQANGLHLAKLHAAAGHHHHHMVDPLIPPAMHHLESVELRKRTAPDDFVREFVEGTMAGDTKIEEITIPVAEAGQCDPSFRAVSEEQVLHSVKWHELELQEAVTRLAKKLAEKRVFGPMLMAKATVAGTNHSNYPNLPLSGIIYIESVCRRTLCPHMSRRQFATYFRPAMKGLAARCRRIRHSLKPNDTPVTGAGGLSMVQVQGIASQSAAALSAAIAAQVAQSAAAQQAAAQAATSSASSSTTAATNGPTAAPSSNSTESTATPTAPAARNDLLTGALG